jgi:lysophospholipase L1-like esterase
VTSSRNTALRGAPIVVAAVALAVWVGGAQAAEYLALGDSVAFGYIRDAGPAYVNADNFVGYPDYVAGTLGLTETSAACPGEATTGFISLTGADNGCRPFRASYPLHVAYTSTQLAFATEFLAAHPTTRLVTIALGANDVLLFQKACGTGPDCFHDGFARQLSTISSNMHAILSGLRAAGFTGVLMVVTYYALDYTDDAATEVTAQLNQALTAPAAANNAVVADAFTAFKEAASTAAGGKTCSAGLLNVDPKDPTQTTCDAHPSQSGAKLIARTVENAYNAAITPSAAE